MTFLATRRRFGRYVYAYGGNPDAAELAGINTRWTILKTYVLMGILCALAGAVASARLNGATLDVGQSYELYVIAAAVVGGTSFAGGIGTIPGAVLGAFVMQALAYGLSFLNVNSPGQNIVGRRRPDRRGRLRHLQPEARLREPREQDGRTPTAVAGAHAARRDAEHQRRLRRRPRRARRVRSTSTRARSIGLVGGNGAGKSTLMRVLSGAHPADSGEILIDGKPVTHPQPARRQGLNIETIYQTLALADNIDAPGERVPRPRADDPLGYARRLEHGGRRPARSWAASTRTSRTSAQPVKSLSGGQRQAVAIARAVYFNARILIMDEPTAALGPAETAQVREPRPPAEGGGHRHLPDQPRHPRRVRPVRPDQRHVPRPDRRTRSTRPTSPRTRSWR